MGGSGRRGRLRLARPPHPLDGREPPAGRRAGRRRAGVGRAHRRRRHAHRGAGPTRAGRGHQPAAVGGAGAGRGRRGLPRGPPAPPARLRGRHGGGVDGRPGGRVGPVLGGTGRLGREPAAGGGAAGRARRRRARPGTRGPDDRVDRHPGLGRRRAGVEHPAGQRPVEARAAHRPARRVRPGRHRPGDRGVGRRRRPGGVERRPRVPGEHPASRRPPGTPPPPSSTTRPDLGRLPAEARDRGSARARHRGFQTGASRGRRGVRAGCRRAWAASSSTRSDCTPATPGSSHRLSCCRGSPARSYSSPSLPSWAVPGA